MNTPNWQDVKRIFNEALAQPAQHRAAYLESVCPDDLTRDEVKSLLSFYEDDPEFLENSVDSEAFRAIEAGNDSVWAGKHIGPYRLEQLIGKGGMGLVYLASRVDGQFDQKVAIKIGKQDEYNPDIIERLWHERQVLASLSHPNIARLLDGGVTEEGRPYFAMEYVKDGLSITEYCQKHGLTTRERLHLFQFVSDAVSYAHRQLIVHRDLKPSNILVSPEGTVKLLDFGLAKLLDESPNTIVPITRTGVRIMTLEYASPEQVRKQQVTTATDVYSAGVVLYELLTGKRPYTVQNLSPTEIEHIICDVDPPKPSTALHGQIPESESPYPAYRSLKGDLDTIILKALAKEPERRYGSMERLNEDISRYLDNLPIAARPATTRYRITKFVRRHRVGVSAVVLIITALLAGILSTSYQATVASRERQKAEQRTTEVRALANSLLFDLHDAIRDLPGATPARRLLVQNAEHYLNSLNEDLPDDDVLRAELAEAYKRVGEIQGDPHYPNLGDLAGASTYYEKALELRKSLWLADSSSTSSRHALALALGRMAVVYSWGGDNDEAIRLSHKAIDMLEGLLDEHLDSDFQQDLGRIRSELGWWYVFAGDMATSKVQLSKAQQELEALASERSGKTDFEIDLWRVYNYQVDAYRWSDNEARALDILERTACPRLEKLNQRRAINPRLRANLSTCLNKTGDLYLARDEPDKAISYFESALRITEWMAASDSTNKLGLKGVSGLLSKLGSVHREMNNITEATTYYDQSLAIKRSLYAADSGNGEAGNTLGITLKLACLFAAEQNLLDQALNRCKDSVAILEQVVAKNEMDGIWQSNLIESYLALARVYNAKAASQEHPEYIKQSIHWYNKGIHLINQLASKDRAFSWPDSLTTLRKTRDQLQDSIAAVN